MSAVLRARWLRMRAGGLARVDLQRHRQMLGRVAMPTAAPLLVWVQMWVQAQQRVQ
jgi:hypothetical protein